MIREHRFYTAGMVCDSCEKIISRAALRLDGVKSIDVGYLDEIATVKFDSEKVTLSQIKKAIEEKGYLCQEIIHTKKPKWVKNLSWAFVGVGIIIIGYFFLQLFNSFNLPELSANMSFGLLFIVGLLTGFHCVSMCGGFVVGYTAKGVKEGKKPTQMHASYAIGKTLSYTIIGGLFGLIGSIIAFTPMIRGIAGLLAGLFLVVFGLKTLNLFPSLRRFNLRMPKFVRKFVAKEHREHKNSPLIIGLLNGLMIACGPLQAVYIMAAGTGSMIEGAKLLFVFGLGTLPVMLGFGWVTSLVGRRATTKILKISGVVVIVLGLIMVNRGLTLTGSGYDVNSLTTGFSVAGDNSIKGVEMKDGYQIIRMEVNRYGWSPDKFFLQKGVPTKWVIIGKELNGCNRAINVPSLNLNFDISPGEQVIEFTPQQSGNIPWSCWMGMIPGMFVVQDGTNNVADSLDTVKLPKAKSCGSSGGCGCGGA